ncbi:hypothetical protein [Billgrantia montanilacus]|uniref:Uncharacterized protein n=1 Tax=Billgrantia montanilacus TaxID=2282305 RepID=A0A368TWU2_9GAMM|nr:hypothetical protein [Halomonas montanilacus]RCV89148.1 hypothetical protein DU505_11365 [Halomonas montanilacus]
MNRITPEALYRLLPAVHRLRDADEGEPLRALVAVLAREGAVVEENIEQLLDNLFIETCADWASPYIGGTIGYRALYEFEGADISNRAEVANTIGYRRRKGTAAVLEALARDVTGWPAHVVEFFQTTATCQHMNQVRPAHHLTPDLRDPLDLEPLGRAFDNISHTVDVRSIQQTRSRRSLGGKHNFANIGLFLWRLIPMPHIHVPATEWDGRRYLFDPLGAPRQLVNLPQPEQSITSISRPEHVPGDISRRTLHADPSLWYGPGRAFEIFVDDQPVPLAHIQACDLSNDGPGWNHSPHDAIPGNNAPVRVDPALGRIAFPLEEPGEVRTRFHAGFPARIGGGQYNRASTLKRHPGQTLIRYPSPDHPNLQSAIDAVAPTGGIVEITTSDVFAESLAIAVEPDVELILRAANNVRPILRPPAAIQITGGAESRIVLNGLVIEGFPIEILPTGDGESPKSMTLRHLTLIPGLAFTAAGDPQSPGATSLAVTTSGLELTIDRAICGPIRMHESTNADIRDSIVDAAALPARNSAEGLAISGPSGEGDPAGALTIVASTIIGRLFARSFPLVSNAILHARTTDGSAPVRALRRQQGCMRFSFVPQASVTPRRYRCQPQLAIDQAVATAEAKAGGSITAAERALIHSRILRRMRPGFEAQSASQPAYAQLRLASPLEIRTGASDEGEMGAFHLLAAPQREANLRIRLEEYLRFGLEAGIFYET